MTHRLVFMGTPEFAVPSLRRLAGSYEVVAVITAPDRPAGRGRQMRDPAVKQVAEDLGLAVLQPSSFKKGAADRIGAMEPQIIVVAAYGRMLPPSVLEIPPRGVVNLHPSLLPRHRGASPVAASILAGDAETGVTLMLMDEGLDTGPVLAQKAVSISEDDTRASLSRRLAVLGADLLVETLPNWIAGGLEPRPQDESEATYSKPLSKRDGLIDWGLDAEAIGRMVRAYHPWPGAFTHWDGRRVKVISAQVSDGDGEPGTVMAAGDGAAVATGEGRLRLREIQLEGGRAMEIGPFLRGHPDFVGARLGDGQG